MKSTFLCLLFGLWSTFGKLNAQETDKSIYFETDRSTLTKASIQILDELVEQLKSAQTYSIELTGHTDAVGTAAYNDALSQRRIQATIGYLGSKGIDATRAKTNPFGEKKPKASNLDPQGRQENRRVDIHVSKTSKSTETIQDLYKQLLKTPETFCINPKRDTVLTCKDGGILVFPANSFVIPESCKDACVTIKVRESYQKSDMVLNNLVTQSNGRVLESGGMIETMAYDCNDQELTLRPEAIFTTFIPAEFPIANPQLFEGQRGHDSSMNWLNIPAVAVEQVNFLEGLICDEIRLFDNSSVPPSCAECRFLCRIRRIDEAFAGIKNPEVKAANITLRECQRLLRKQRRRRKVLPNITPSGTYTENCSKLDSLLKQYNVLTREELLLAINKTKMDFYQVKTLQELQDTLAKIYLMRRDSIQKAQDLEREIKVTKGEASAQETNYYIFKNSGLGWKNVDCFSMVPNDKKTQISFSEEPSPNIDIKVAVTGLKVMIGTNALKDGKLSLTGIPKKENIWIIALKIENKQPYLYMKQTVVEENKTYPIVFEAKSVEEIKAAVQQLNQ